MNFAGRAVELREVERLLERAASGSGSVLVFTGPSGVGKTSMLDASAAHAARRGFQVVRTLASSRPSRRALCGRDSCGMWGADDELVLASSGNPVRWTSTAPPGAGLGRTRLLVLDDIDRGGPEWVETGRDRLGDDGVGREITVVGHRTHVDGKRNVA